MKTSEAHLWKKCLLRREGRVLRLLPQQCLRVEYKRSGKVFVLFLGTCFVCRDFPSETGLCGERDDCGVLMLKQRILGF